MKNIKSSMHSLPFHFNQGKREMSLLLLLLLFIPATLFVGFGRIVTDNRSYGPSDSLGEPVSNQAEPSSLMQVNTQIAAGSDDDCWWYNESSDYLVHRTGQNYLETRAYSSGNWAKWAQFRWALPIPNGAIIQSATISLYVTQEHDDQVIINRIDETNVGPLENDAAMPIVDGTVSAAVGCTSVGWTTSTSVRDMVQDHVNHPSWQSGFYFGVRLNNSGAGIGYTAYRSYEGNSSRAAYIDVTYTLESGWLNGWPYRMSHTIMQEPGADINYTIPVYVHRESGTSFYDDARVGFKCQDDFDDIRFTAGNGITQLEYSLSGTWTSSPEDWFNNITTNYISIGENQPNAYYYNGRTYISFMGDLDMTKPDAGVDEDIHIQYYDHDTKRWSGVWFVATNPNHDSHGAPVMWVNNTGHFHIVYGAHNQDFKHVSSTYPEDCSHWTKMPDIDVQRGTYVQASYDSGDNTVHMIYRSRGSSTDKMWIRYINSTDGGQTWNSERILVEGEYLNDDNHDIFYKDVAGWDSNLNSFHVSWTLANNNRSNHQWWIFYAYYNGTDGHMYNANGDDLGVQVDWWEQHTDCRVKDYANELNTVSPPSTHVDDEGNPYILYQVQNESGVLDLEFTYWDSSMQRWISDIITTIDSGVAASFLLHDKDNATAFIGDTDEDLHVWTWDGLSWTDNGEVYADNFLYGGCPGPWDSGPHEELAFIVSMSATYGSGTPVRKKSCAFGLDGTLLVRNPVEFAKFYVKIPDDLSVGDATIYLYYGNADATTTGITFQLTTGYDPRHGEWGPEERITGNAPQINQIPICTNLDNSEYLYARNRDYEITVSVSDPDGITDIDYVEITMLSDDRLIAFWTLRFDMGTSLFSERSDPHDYITLSTQSSSSISIENIVNVTFGVLINWNHPNLRDIDIKSIVVDYSHNSAINYHEVNWDVETRLDMLLGPQLSDGIGTPDRGDINGDILASGSIVYFDSTLCPPASEFDLYVICTNVSTSPWRITNYKAIDGTFSVSVQADDELGRNLYRFIPVPKDAGPDGMDLLDEIHTCTYIADGFIVSIAEDEASSNETTIAFSITITYGYDGLEVSHYTALVCKNDVPWQIVSSGFTDIRDLENNFTYAIVSVNETVHGLSTLLEAPSAFVISGDSSDGDIFIIAEPEAALKGFSELAAYLREVVYPLLAIANSIDDLLLYVLNTVTVLVSPWDIRFMLFAAVTVAAAAVMVSRTKGHHKVQNNRRKKETIKKLDFEIYTLLSTEAKGSCLRTVTNGIEKAYLVLEADSKQVSECIRLSMAAGRMPKRLLKMFSSPLETGKKQFSLLGLILEDGEPDD